MDKKFRYVCRMAINIIRMPFLRIISLGNICIPVKQLASITAKIRCYNGGSIIVKGLANIEEGTLLESIGGALSIGNNCMINRNGTVVCMESIRIGDNVSIGPNVCIYDHDHNLNKSNTGGEDFVSKPIIIENNVWIGANVTVLKGVTIHKNAVIAAGTTVTKDVLENEIVGGSPCKLLKKRL